ncbi:MAG: class I SAM-dependent methyltransferase, partial [Saprospiraceae bacterium]|nr:class I SAM-dependent methyltransferase [Saprospiraceae bacterium]
MKKIKRMEIPERNYTDINRELWNAKTEVHVKSEFYGLSEFRQGKNVLTPIELEQVGDVQGKTLLHLQCHFGMDTLCWARLGAEVIGIDLSDKAIDFAKQLAKESDLDARFISCNIYDLPQHLDEEFDIVFTSYGTIGWLPDLKPWGEIIARYLKPGGAFHFAEFHPVPWMFDNDYHYIQYSYFNKETIIEELEGTYADRNAPIKKQSISWNHSLSEVFEALLSQGLRI